MQVSPPKAVSAAMPATRSIAYAVVKSMPWQVTVHEVDFDAQHCFQGREKAFQEMFNSIESYIPPRQPSRGGIPGTASSCS